MTSYNNKIQETFEVQAESGNPIASTTVTDEGVVYVESIQLDEEFSVSFDYVDGYDDTSKDVSVSLTVASVADNGTLLSAEKGISSSSDVLSSGLTPSGVTVPAGNVEFDEYLQDGKNIRFTLYGAESHDEVFVVEQDVTVNCSIVGRRASEN